MDQQQAARHQPRHIGRGQSVDTQVWQQRDAGQHRQGDDRVRPDQGSVAFQGVADVVEHMPKRIHEHQRAHQQQQADSAFAVFSVADQRQHRFASTSDDHGGQADEDRVDLEYQIRGEFEIRESPVSNVACCQHRANDASEQSHRQVSLHDVRQGVGETEQRHLGACQCSADQQPVGGAPIGEDQHVLQIAFDPEVEHSAEIRPSPAGIFVGFVQNGARHRTNQSDQHDSAADDVCQQLDDDYRLQVQPTLACCQRQQDEAQRSDRAETQLGDRLMEHRFEHGEQRRRDDTHQDDCQVCLDRPLPVGESDQRRQCRGDGVDDRQKTREHGQA